MNDDFRFLRDRTAYWLGVKCLQDRKLIVATKTIKDELMKVKEYFNRTIPANADERTRQYQKTLNSVILGETV